MKSSSVHRYNADGGMSYLGKVLWLILNWLNNSWFANVKNANLVMCDFKPELSEERWNQAHENGASPGRTLSNLFLMELPWERIEHALGHIHVMDVGCGSGNNAARLQAWSGGRLSSYLGFDVREHEIWSDLERRHAECRFVCADVVDISKHLSGDINFIMSQSAVEHFEDDIALFNEIRAFLDAKSKPAMQVHLFPSAVCMRLYPWHGVRQYTPRTVSLLTSIFNESSCTRLYRLGGLACNKVLREFITAPLLRPRDVDKRRRARPNYYSRSVRAAIESDMASQQSAPSFYALVIESYSQDEMFQ